MWLEVVPPTISRKDGSIVHLKSLLQEGFFELTTPSKSLATKELDGVQDVINYRFRDVNFLRRALTHPSFDAQNSYERLEFIGDAVLGKC